MRTLLLLLVLGGAGCDDNLAGVGQACSSSGDCAQGLLCDFGRTPHTCQPAGTVHMDLAVPGDLAGADFAGEDLSSPHD